MIINDMSNDIEKKIEKRNYDASYDKLIKLYSELSSLLYTMNNQGIDTSSLMKELTGIRHSIQLLNGTTDIDEILSKYY